MQVVPRSAVERQAAGCPPMIFPCDCRCPCHVWNGDATRCIACGSSPSRSTSGLIGPFLRLMFFLAELSPEKFVEFKKRLGLAGIAFPSRLRVFDLMGAFTDD